MRRPRSRLRRVLLVVGGLFVAAVASVAVAAAAAPIHRDGASAASSASAAPTRVLVLYDTGGQWGFLGGQYVTDLTKMTGHLGDFVAHPVTGYQAGELNRYRAVIYLGSTYDEPVPAAFLDDVLKTRKQVLWANDNIWRLTARAGDFAKRYGFIWKGFDHGVVDRVVYRGVPLTRDLGNDFGIMDEWITDPGRVTVLGTASRSDGTSFPWALRSGNFTYVGEVPLEYASATDRYLAFADLVYDVLATTPEPKHHVEIETQHLASDPDPVRLRAVVTALYGRDPFTGAAK
jgi:uncharacterized protein YdaL